MKIPGIFLYFATVLLFLECLAAYQLNIDNIHKGEYSYRYDTDDGTIMEDRKGIIDENGDQVVVGSYTFLIDNTQYTVTYKADKNGYHPKITMSNIPPVAETPAQFSLPPRAVASILG